MRTGKNLQSGNLRGYLMNQNRTIIQFAILSLLCLLPACDDGSVNVDKNTEKFVTAKSDPSKGVVLEVSVPESSRSGNPVNMTVTVTSNEEFAGIYGAGHAIDCRILIQDQKGRIVQYSKLGKKVFSGERGQIGVTQLVPGSSKTWTCNLNQHFNFDFRYHRYRLSLKTQLEDPLNRNRVYQIAVENVLFRIE